MTEKRKKRTERTEEKETKKNKETIDFSLEIDSFLFFSIFSVHKERRKIIKQKNQTENRPIFIKVSNFQFFFPPWILFFSSEGTWFFSVESQTERARRMSDTSSS